jgi:hypothetical protein
MFEMQEAVVRYECCGINQSNVGENMLTLTRIGLRIYFEGT